MAINPFKTFSAGEVLTASDLNSSFTQITSNALSLISPLTGTLDADGNKIVLDADGDSSITADTDDQLDIELAGSDVLVLTKTSGAASSDAAKLASINGHGIWGRRNLLINGDFRRSQRGAAFTSASTPANSDGNYLADRWVLLSDGNDVVDVNVQSDAVLGNYAYLEADIETVSKKFGFVQFIEQQNLPFLLGSDKTVSLSFRAKVSDAAKLDDIRAVVLSWTGTADAPTKDIVSAWNAAGTVPTWVASYTQENTPVNLSVTATEGVYRIEGISIDASGVKNLAVFIWSDAVANNDTLGTLLQITDIQLEPGSTATSFEHIPMADLIRDCERYYERRGPDAAVVMNYAVCQSYNGGATADGVLNFSEKRGTPVCAVSAASDFNLKKSDETEEPVGTFVIDEETKWSARLNLGVTSGLTAGGAALLRGDGNFNDWIEIDAELGA